MVLERIGQVVKFAPAMVVRNFGSGGFPDMLLGIEFRCGCRENNDFETRVGIKHSLNGWTPMPGCFVPEEQNRLVRKGSQQLEQKECTGLGIHEWGTQDRLLTCGQVQSTIEVRTLSTWMTLHPRRLPAWMPDEPQGRLQIK